MTLKFVTLDHETIAYREQGEGENTLVLLHGNMTSSQHYDVLLAQLPKDLKVYAIDLRGFGGSSYNNRVNHLKDFSDDVKGVVDKLGLKNFSIAGWSTGGGIAMQYCIDYPTDVNKLILIESVGVSGYPIFRKDEMGQPILGDFLTTKEELEVDQVQVLPILNAYKNKDKATLKAIWNALIYTTKQPDENQYDIYLNDMMTQKNLVDVDYALMYFNISDDHNGVVAGSGDARKINHQTLVFQGKNDLVVPQMMGEGIHAHLKKSTYILHDGGHSPLIDDIDHLTTNIVTFLKDS